MNDYEWCITEDWETPVKGEEWHEADSPEDAQRQFYDKMGPFPNWSIFRFIQKKGRTIIDFGSHERFCMIRRKETPK
jgi:hypothetical protein